MAAHLEPPVLQAAEVQQLLHHVVEAGRLVVDDLQPLAVVFVLRVVEGAQGLHPAPDGGQRRAQLMGDRADEFILHLLGLFQPLGHPVDGAAQPVYLVAGVAGHGQTDVQLTPGDAGGGALLPQRHHDAPHEIQAGRHRKAQDGDDHHDADEEDIFQLVLHQCQAGDQPHGGHILGRIGHKAADRHDHFAAVGAVDGHPHAVAGLLRLFEVRTGQDELVFVLIGKLLHHPAQSHAPAGRSFLGRVAGVHFQLAADGGKAAVHGLLDAVVIATGAAVQEHPLHQKHQQHRHQQTAAEPPPGDAAPHSSHR